MEKSIKISLAEELTNKNVHLLTNIQNIVYFDEQILRIDYRKGGSSSKINVMNYNDLNEKEHKKIKYDYSYIRMTDVWKENSHAKRKKVGALFVKDNTIISDGFNGTPSGFPNACEDENNISYSYVMHAEQNAISKLARSTNSADGSTLYQSMSPCPDCSKQIMQCGAKRLVFWDFYRKVDGIKWILKTHIEVDFYFKDVLEKIYGLQS